MRVERLEGEGLRHLRGALRPRVVDPWSESSANCVGGGWSSCGYPSARVLSLLTSHPPAARPPPSFNPATPPLLAPADSRFDLAHSSVPEDGAHLRRNLAFVACRSFVAS